MAVTLQLLRAEMDAIRKRASAFREQVAKQQQVLDVQILLCSTLSLVTASFGFFYRVQSYGNNFSQSNVLYFQAVLKTFSGHSQGDSLILDEAELQRHQQLEKLYISTKAAKVLSAAISSYLGRWHLQREFGCSTLAVSSRGLHISLSSCLWAMRNLH